MSFINCRNKLKLFLDLPLKGRAVLRDLSVHGEII
jgi:hypothetical protein